MKEKLMKQNTNGSAVNRNLKTHIKPALCASD
jgi:hypothetical protein